MPWRPLRGLPAEGRRNARGAARRGSRDEAFEVIRSLIDEIRLVPADGELRIEIKGELAGILELCDAGANQKTGGLSTPELAEQIKVVAGARNHLYRTTV